MFTRKVVTASAAALALVALSVPVVNAQDDGSLAGDADSGSISLGSLEGGSLDAGSLAAGSDGPAEGESDGDEVAGSGSLGDGSLGDLDSASGEDTSLGDLVPSTDGVCELPALGGSVAKFYPLFGIDGIPTGVLDLITSALDSFPNLLDVVAGEGGGAALVGETGSLGEGLCTLVLGGEMVPPPVTVIVDGDGNPVTTVTGTPTSSSASVTSTATSSGSSTTPGVETSDGGPGGAPAETGADAADAGEPTPATSVPVPAA